MQRLLSVRRGCPFPTLILMGDTELETNSFLSLPSHSFCPKEQEGLQWLGALLAHSSTQQNFCGITQDLALQRKDQQILEISSIQRYALLSIFVWDSDTKAHALKVLRESKDLMTFIVWGLLGDSDSKASAYNAGDPGSIPELGRSPGEGNGTPLQYSCLENPMDGEAW